MVDKTVNLTDLQECKVLDGDLIWVKSSGKETCVGQCGDITDLQFIEKLFNKEQKIVQRSFGDEELRKRIENIFSTLKETSYEGDRVKLRDSFINDFYNVFLLSESEGNLIDWVMACYNSFYDLPVELEEIYMTKNIEALRRSLLVSSITVLTTFSLGYLSWDFLKKVFNSMLLIDVDFVKMGLSSYHLDKLEEQRRTDEPSLNEGILKLSKLHGQKGIDDVKKVSGSLASVEAMVKFHHEILNTGTGPEGVFASELSDLQVIASFCERIVPYKNFHYKQGDATGFIKKGIDKVDGYIRFKRMITIEARGIA